MWRKSCVKQEAIDYEISRKEINREKVDAFQVFEPCKYVYIFMRLAKLTPLDLTRTVSHCSVSKLSMKGAREWRLDRSKLSSIGYVSFVARVIVSHRAIRI